MAASCQVVRFQKDSTNVDGATQDVNLNFTPKAIIVYSDCNSANATVSAHYQMSVGFSDGTNSAVFVNTSDDADAAADTQRYHNTNGVYLRMLETNNATIEERATVAFAANKVTFTWAVNSAQASYIHLIAFGGDDITNAKVNTVDAGRATTGTQDYTGLGFNPVEGNAVLFTMAGFDTALSASSQLIGYLNFGCAVSSTKRWHWTNLEEDTADPSDTWRRFSNNRCLSHLTPSDGTLFADADFSAWITDGFRLDWTDAPDATTRKFSYLVINGGTWDAGILTTPSTPTNDVDTAVSVSSFTIRGLLLASTSTVSGNENTSDATAMGGIGSTDGTNQTAIGNIDEDAQPTMDSYRINTAASVVRIITNNGADQHTATIDSFTTNNFRLDWSAASGAIFVGWVVVADSTSAAAAAEEYPSISHGNIHQNFNNNTTNVIGTIFG